MGSWNHGRWIVASLAALTLHVACQSAPAPTPPAPAAQDAPSDPAAAAPSAAHDPLRAAIDAPDRPEAERARDAWRHPYETLTFFEVKPDAHVLELWAGRGWYTHILAPYLGERGKLYLTTYAPDAQNEYLRKVAAELTQRMSALKHADRVQSIVVEAPDRLDLGLEAQVDVVLTFRNLHNWVKGGYDKTLYEQAHKALKPGGIFGVVEHRGPKGLSREDAAKTGYMDQDQVIADISAVGFELVEASEINANPKDTRDHPEGVWTLPPSLRLGEVDRQRYLDIGESDRMTLKFRKK